MSTGHWEKKTVDRQSLRVTSRRNLGKACRPLLYYISQGRKRIHGKSEGKGTKEKVFDFFLMC